MVQLPQCMMDEFFMYQQNWQKIEGERGVNGIDGLYIKSDEESITDVLIAKSKYNHTRLFKLKPLSLFYIQKEEKKIVI